MVIFTLWMLDIFFLIFINYSWHCLQTVFISWKQLYFLKSCCPVSLVEMSSGHWFLMQFLYKQRYTLYGGRLLIYCPIKLLGLFCAQAHGDLETERLCFGFRVQCMGTCSHLGPGLYLQSGFTYEGWTLDGFNSIILLFIINLSHNLSFHFSFYPWLLSDWVVLWFPFLSFVTY